MSRAHAPDVVAPSPTYRSAPWWWPFGRRPAQGSWEPCRARTVTLTTALSPASEQRDHWCLEREPHRKHRCLCGVTWESA